MAEKDKVQGEGDYEAARHYRDAVDKTVKSGHIEDKARQAEPHSEAEEDELEQAEEEGKRHAKE